MSDLWLDLFSHHHVSQRDIKRLTADGEFNDARIDTLEAERQRLTERVDRAELLVHALWSVLKSRLKVTDDELRVMIARIDLEDGREDGKVGQKRDAPMCSKCGRPLNLERSSCIYCDTPMVQAHQVSKPKKRPVRTVSCQRCSATVPERDTYFSEVGLLCGPCYSAPAGESGSLSLSDTSGGELSDVTGEGGLSEADL